METTLANQLLIAMPGMADPNFSTTVTLICEHNDEGALGIVINRPLNLKLSGLFEQLELEDADPGAGETPVLMGGPVGPERGFVLHDCAHSYENSLSVSSEICLTLSRDIIDAMASGDGPEQNPCRARAMPAGRPVSWRTRCWRIPGSTYLRRRTSSSTCRSPIAGQRQPAPSVSTSSRMSPDAGHA